MSASLTDQATPANLAGGGRRVSGASETDNVGIGHSGGIFDTLVDDLQSEVTTDGKSRISQVRALVEHMSDLERLLLYLQLPNGVAAAGAIDPAILQAGGASMQLSNQLEQSQAFTWIQSHLEEDASICLRKDEVYNDYRSYCDSHGQKALNTADFGKVMKRAFPNVKPRRLGQRGQSKYCYGGLRKKTDLPHPVMPDLSMAELDAAASNNSSGNAAANNSGISGNYNNTNNGVSNDESMAIYSEIIIEWAQKIMGCQFHNLRQLAEHLVTNMYVNSRSPAAMTLFSSLQSRSQQRLSFSQLNGLRAAAAAAAAQASANTGDNGVKVEGGIGGGTNSSRLSSSSSSAVRSLPMGIGPCWSPGWAATSPDSLNSSVSGALDTSGIACVASPSAAASSSTNSAPPSRPHLMPLPHQITKKTFRSPLPQQHQQQQQQQQPPPPPPMLYHHQNHRPNVHHHSALALSAQSSATSVVPSPSSSSTTAAPVSGSKSSSLNPSPGKKVCSDRHFQPLGTPLNPQLLEQEVSSTEQHYIPLMSPISSKHRGGGCSPAPHWGPPSAALSPLPSGPPPQSSQQQQQQQQQQSSSHSRSGQSKRSSSQSFGIAEPISLPPDLGRSPSPQFPPVSPEQYLPALPRIGTSPLPRDMLRPVPNRRSPMPSVTGSAGIEDSPAGRSTVSSSSSPQQQQQGQQLLLLR